MRVKATTTFAGKISMYAGEVREIKPGATLDDLLRSNYVEETEPGEKKKTTKKVVKSIEN